MKLTRRSVLIAAAATPLLGMAGSILADEAEKHSFELAKESFIIDGKRRFLLAGAIDYFRCPSELWRDRLLKAKRAGINCIATLVEWNLHEPEEGRFDFSGDQDLPRFLDICKELDLWVFLRVGPFVCGEWEAGGYPAWLFARKDLELRAHHPATEAAIRRWLSELIPRVAPKQATRGGAIVMVQQENEYFFYGRPGAAEYQDFLIHTMKEFGIDVPITDCNGFIPEIRRPESMLTHNGWGSANPARMRKFQPGKPLVISEFYTDWMWSWGEQEHAIEATAPEVRRQTFECLAAGAMPVYFMFHGGTSFGFMASRSAPADYSFITPEYFGHGPIAQGGALNEMYFAVKAATMAGLSLEDALAGSAPAKVPLKVDGAVKAIARKGDKGILLFLFEESRKNAPAAAGAWITLPSGSRVAVAQDLKTPAILPVNLRTMDGHTIDFSNATVAGLAPNAVVLSGGEGSAGVVSIDGEVKEFTFAAEPLVLRAGGATVLAVSSGVSQRTWIADGRVIVGPAYVGERRGGQHECWCDEQTKSVRVLSDGTLKDIKLPAIKPDDAREVHLTDWRAIAFAEISDTEQKGVEWKYLPGPAHVEELHAYFGYTWYRASYHSDAARQSALMFTDATDRVHAFHNGRRVGNFGRGTGTTRDPIPVDLIAGDNRFVFLCDNMGRASEGNFADRKGIGGSVHVDARTMAIKWTHPDAPTAPPTNSWRFQTYQSRTRPRKFARFLGEMDVSPGQKLVISLRLMPQFAWVSFNDQPLEEHGGGLTLIDGYQYSTYVIDAPPAGTGKLEIVTCGEPIESLADNVAVASCPRDGALTNWGFRKWSAPDGAAPTAADQPTCWRTRFPRPVIAGPLFFDPRGLSKGHVFLNGRAVSRYWDIGPQKTLYLPEPWFAEDNELIVFDELGKSPAEARMRRDGRVPTEMVLA